MSNNNLSNHILPVSATMVGICMTAISLMRLVPDTQWLDNIVAFDSLFFMGSALFSYTSIRARRNTEKLERYADNLFVVGMILMVVINFLFAFDLLKS